MCLYCNNFVESEGRREKIVAVKFLQSNFFSAIFAVQFVQYKNKSQKNCAACWTSSGDS